MIWSLTAQALARAERDMRGSVGGRRIAEVVGWLCEQAIDSKFLVSFLQREPERALRLLTTSAPPVQATVSNVEQLLRSETDSAKVRQAVAALFR